MTNLKGFLPGVNSDMLHEIPSREEFLSTGFATAKKQPLVTLISVVKAYIQYTDPVPAL